MMEFMFREGVIIIAAWDVCESPFQFYTHNNGGDGKGNLHSII